ncbi:hypothetical protein FJZ53_02125 [Candidatus Woesearchaeota archaeon]|nr:hypothetical protein [Candidatus Woesearchaeota archaeon]
METKIERISIKGLTIKDLLNSKFLTLIEEEKLKLDYVNLLSFSRIQEKSSKKISFSPIVLSHDKSDEIENKVLHLSADDENNLKIIEKVLKKLIK